MCEPKSDLLIPPEELEDPAAAGPEAPLPDNGGPPPLLRELERMEGKIDRLGEEFQTKLKHDAHKEKVIDRLHDELQQYRQDFQNRPMQSLILDVIKVIDDIRKLTRFYHDQGPREGDADKLLQILEKIPADLEDLCSWQGVTPFVSGSGAFDPSRQRVVQKIDTPDPSRDKTVAQSVRPGYEWDQKVIRPEMVAIYVYHEP